MALVHEQLYQSGKFSEIDFSAYVKEMITKLVQSNLIDNHIKLNFQLSGLRLSIDKASAFCNEWVFYREAGAFPARDIIRCIRMKNP